MQFARVAHATGFVYCYSIMEANRRSDYAPNTEGGRPPSKPKSLVFEQSMTSELNTFFPLDRKSTRLNSSHSGESRMPSSA